MATLKKEKAGPAVVREYHKVGDYRARLMVNERVDGKPHVLDVREYLESKLFTGWTRRGIRLYSRREAADLLAILERVLEEGSLPEEVEQR